MSKAILDSREVDVVRSLLLYIHNKNETTQKLQARNCLHVDGTTQCDLPAVDGISPDLCVTHCKELVNELIKRMVRGLLPKPRAVSIGDPTSRFESGNDGGGISPEITRIEFELNRARDTGDAVGLII